MTRWVVMIPFIVEASPGGRPGYNKPCTTKEGQAIMKYLRYGWVVLLTALLLALTVTPVSAAQRTVHRAAKPQDTTNINATIYLSNALLQPLFQSRIDDAVPTAVNNAIAGIVGGLPTQDRGWAQQMATTLLQPSATLVSLVPDQGGLMATLRV